MSDLCSIRKHLDEVLKRDFADLQPRTVGIIDDRIPVGRRILFSLVVPSKPRLQPRVLSPIEQRLEDGNRAKRQEKDDTHDVSIELRAFQSSVPMHNSKENLTVA